MHKKLKQLISIEECQQLVKSVKENAVAEEDTFVPGSKVYYNLPDFSILLGLLCSKISKQTKKNLRPTYGFCRIYTKGCELKPHKDRPTCEYSLSINLQQSHKWGIFFDKKEVILGVGDAVLYKGCEVEHYRPKFEGDEYIQLFLHYVDLDGPQKEYSHAPQISTLLTFNFIKVNRYLSEHLEIASAFTPEECNFLRDQHFDVKPGRVGTEEGVLSEVRKSRIFWIPRTFQWKGLYEKLMGIIEQCNREYYNFEITGLSENLQYTEYEAEYEGYYDYHLDIGSGIESSRKLSITVQLSDESEYEGGELEFVTGCEKKHATKKQGDVIVFPSYLLHKVNPITRGKRCSLVTWIGGPPFR